MGGHLEDFPETGDGEGRKPQGAMDTTLAETPNSGESLPGRTPREEIKTTTYPQNLQS